MHYQQVIEKLLSGQPIPESTLRLVCAALIEVLAEQSNLLVLDAPIHVVGDVHGQFYDVLGLLAKGAILAIQEAFRLRAGISFWGTTSTAAIIHLKPFSSLLRGNHESRYFSSETAKFPACMDFTSKLRKSMAPPQFGNFLMRSSTISPQPRSSTVSIVKFR